MVKARSNDPLTHDQARELINYSPRSGRITWHSRPLSMFPSYGAWRCWNTRYAGQEAGTVKKGHGYIQIAIKGTLYLNHRLAWFWMTGTWPAEIDHRDGDTANNRWSNLRMATTSQNMANRAVRKDNKSGLKGVRLDSRRGTWVMTTQKHGIKVTKSGFPTAEAAYEAYCAAAAKLHGEFARTG
jgi:hypothetical protein